MDIFELFGTIAINNDQANKALSDTGKQANGLSDKMEAAFSKIQGTARKIGTAVATAFAVDKIKDFGFSCAETFASVAAEESAFAQIMGDYADRATEKMNLVADQTGVIATRLTPYMTSMTAKFKGLGYGVEEATNMASEGLMIASDAAAFWDRSLDDSMSHLNSFINGSYEGGEAIGLFANDTQMAAYAVSKGIVKETKAWSELNEAAKQSTRLQYAKEMMAKSGATGQAATEAENYANVQANLNEQMRQFHAVIGEPIMNNIMLPAMRRVNQMMPGIIEKTEKLMEGFTKGLGKLSAFFANGLDVNALSASASKMFDNMKKIVHARLTDLKNTLSEKWNTIVWPEIQKLFKAEFDLDLPDWPTFVSEIQTKWESEVVPSIQGYFSEKFNIKLPDWAEIRQSIETNWSSIVMSGLATILTGKFTISLPLWLTLLDNIKKKWETLVYPGIQDFFKGEFSITLPDWTELLGNITSNWDTNVAPGVKELFETLGGNLSEALGTGGETLGILISGVKDFGAWCVDNKDTISEFFLTMAGEAGDGILAAGELLTLAMEAIKGLAIIGTEAVTGALEWILTHGEETAAILETLAVGFAVAAIAAHPYAAAIVAAAAALGLMAERNADGDAYNHYFDQYTEEDLAKLQNYVEAAREAQVAQDALFDALDAGEDTTSADEALRKAQARRDAALAEADAVDGLISTYNTWRNGQAASNGGGEVWLDVPLRVSEDSAANMQNDISGMGFEGVVKMIADTSGLQAAINATGLTAYVNYGSGGVDGSHANGLDFVPRDGYLARLHKGEAVLTSSEASAWRSGSMGGDTSKLEAAINNLAVMMQQVVNNTAAGHSVVLDSGVLVGQMAPALDTQLGTISSRKGRRN